MRKKIQPITIVRYLMVAVLLVFIIFLQADNKVSKTSIDTVISQVSASADLSNMVPSDNRMFKRLYGLSASDYEGVVLYSPVSNMAAEELLIVKLNETSQLDSVKAAVEKRLETQLDSFDGYGVEQTKLLQDHVLYAKGNYIFYMVHADAAQAEQAFLKSL